MKVRMEDKIKPRLFRRVRMDRRTIEVKLTNVSSGKNYRT